MADVLCENCKKVMKKKGILNMSNSKYESYVCTHCGADKMICVGLVK